MELLIFASGGKEPKSGGSGFENLYTSYRRFGQRVKIAAVVSNHPQGGVWARAKRLNVPFIHFPAPWTAEKYQWLVRLTKADFTALSGWLKPVTGLDPRTTFNIHPAPLPQFGGKGMYGHHAHQAVVDAFRRGEITESAVTMHFVTEKYDDGPVFFTHPVPIFSGDDADSLGQRVLGVEHFFQPMITEKVVLGEISWDGVDPASLKGAILR